MCKYLNIEGLAPDADSVGGLAEPMRRYAPEPAADFSKVEARVTAHPDYALWEQEWFDQLAQDRYERGRDLSNEYCAADEAGVPRFGPI